MAEELGMEFLPKLNHTPSYSPIKDEKFVGDYLKIGKNVKFDVNYQNANFKPCGQLWFSPQINWDGKLLGCCVNRYGDFGNVFEKGLKKALKGEKYRYAKKMVLGKVKPREDIPCYNCKYFNNIKNRNNSIKNDIII
ncbi:SPASM domain-containing protein [Candidatus Woesearchaeota archaeon]|nr:SPASM domain-containing protein [Candidatus Woesearchaeota archaeon]